MAGFTCAQQFIILDQRELERRTSTTRDQSTSSPPQFHINFKFSYKTLNYYWVLPQNSGQPQLLTWTSSSHWIVKLIRLNLQQFLSYEEAHNTLYDAINDWPAWDETRRMCVDFAWDKARVVVRRMSPRHNTINLHFRFLLSKMNVFDERPAAIQESIDEEDVDDINVMVPAMQSLVETLAVQQSIDEDIVMVPATESSIETLERKTMMDSGMCSICMEEFSYGCESLSMPCLHVFHGDCIRKWLNASHYCPLCRFEMPTS